MNNVFNPPIINRKKHLWLTQRYLAGTGGVLAGQLGGYATSLLANNQDDDVYYSGAIPSDFLILVKAVAVLIPASVTGNLYLTCVTANARAGQAYNTHAGSVAVAEIAGVSNQLLEYDIATALTELAANDYVGVKISRIGTNILDTAEGTAHILGVLLEYTW
jgi:carbohydrate-selective porin OprB